MGRPHTSGSWQKPLPVCHLRLETLQRLSTSKPDAWPSARLLRDPLSRLGSRIVTFCHASAICNAQNRHSSDPIEHSIGEAYQAPHRHWRSARASFAWHGRVAPRDLLPIRRQPRLSLTESWPCTHALLHRARFHAPHGGCKLPAKTGQRVTHGRTGTPDRAIERTVQLEQEKDRCGNRQRADQQGCEDRCIARRK